MTTSKKPIGRPRKPVGEKYKTTVRQLGRVSDADWAELKAACGTNFTAWAVPILLRAARRAKK